MEELTASAPFPFRKGRRPSSSTHLGKRSAPVKNGSIVVQIKAIASKGLNGSNETTFTLIIVSVSYPGRVSVNKMKNST